MLSQQDTDGRCPRKQSRKPYEGHQWVRGEMLTSRDHGAHLKVNTTAPCCSACCSMWSVHSASSQSVSGNHNFSWTQAEKLAPEAITEVLIKQTVVLGPLSHTLQLAWTGSHDRGHHGSYIPSSIWAQPKIPCRSNTEQGKWQQRSISSRVLITGSPPMWQLCCFRLSWISQDRYGIMQKHFLLPKSKENRIYKYCAILLVNLKLIKSFESSDGGSTRYLKR